MLKDQDKRVLFAIKPGDGFAEGPTLIFMLTEESWTYMRNGLGHEFDLTKIGIPLKILMSRTKDHKTGMETLCKLGFVDENTKDVRAIELGTPLNGKTTVQ